MRKLTEAFIESLPTNGQDSIVFDQSLPGFGIRTTASGKKLFIARARIDGRRRYVSLGEFPDTKLADARRDARRALEAIKEGHDPAAERTARLKAAEAGQTTVEALALRWMAEIVTPKRKPRTAADYQRLIDQKIGPEFGHLIVTAVDREQVIRWHARMANTPRRANYALATLKALLNFAEDIGLRPPHTNPCRRIEMYREKGRERFLSEAEIATAADAITKAEQDGKIGHHAAAGLRLALFTGARSGEITATKWAHVDFDRKIIRLPDSKTNEPRTIHLSDAALQVLKSTARVGPYVIAGAKPGEPLKNLSRSWIVARAYGGLGDVRLHDLRHSYASLAASRGVSLQMIGKLLGHKVAATTARYAHLARDAAAAVNDELGAAMSAAIDKGTRPKGRVLRIPKALRSWDIKVSDQKAGTSRQVEKDKLIAGAGGAPATAPFRLEARRLAAEVCCNWTKSELPFDKSYRLLSAEDVEHAWIADMREWAHGSGFEFPVQADTGQYMFCDFRKLIPRLRGMVLEELRTGELIACGIEPGNELRAKRTDVPPNSWNSLTPDFASSRIFGLDQKLVASNVLVRRHTGDQSAKRAAVRVPTGILKDWFNNDYAPQFDQGRIPTMKEAEAAAKAKFGDRVTRRPVLALHKAKWTAKPGPRATRR